MLTFPIGKQNHIAIIDGFLTDEFCDELVQFCKDNFKLLFERGVMLERMDTTYKNTFDWGINEKKNVKLSEELDSKIQQFDKIIFTSLANAINEYKSHFSSLDGWTSINDTGYRIQKYLQCEGFYKSHIDGAPWCNGASNRVLGIVIYLNDVEEGGETGFPSHDYKVKAVKGRISIFPAYWTHPHTAEIPMSDEKWIISSFITI